MAESPDRDRHIRRPARPRNVRGMTVYDRLNDARQRREALLSKAAAKPRAAPMRRADGAVVPEPAAEDDEGRSLPEPPPGLVESLFAAPPVPIESPPPEPVAEPPPPIDDRPEEPPKPSPAPVAEADVTAEPLQDDELRKWRTPIPTPVRRRARISLLLGILILSGSIFAWTQRETQAELPADPPVVVFRADAALGVVEPAPARSLSSVSSGWKTPRRAPRPVAPVAAGLRPPLPPEIGATAPEPPSRARPSAAQRPPPRPALPAPEIEAPVAEVARAAPPPVDAAPPGTLRDIELVLHVPTGVAASARDALIEAARSAGFAVDLTRPASVTISRTNVRFYHSEDAEAARALAAAIGARARDFTSFRPLPPLGIVEIWMAGSAGRGQASRPAGANPQPSGIEAAIREALDENAN